MRAPTGRFVLDLDTLARPKVRLVWALLHLAAADAPARPWCNCPRGGLRCPWVIRDSTRPRRFVDGGFFLPS